MTQVLCSQVNMDLAEKNRIETVHSMQLKKKTYGHNYSASSYFLGPYRLKQLRILFFQFTTETDTKLRVFDRKQISLD